MKAEKQANRIGLRIWQRRRHILAEIDQLKREERKLERLLDQIVAEVAESQSFD